MKTVIKILVVVRNIVLIPLTLLLLGYEWYHFKISNSLVGLNRKYRKWLVKHL